MSEAGPLTPIAIVGIAFEFPQNADTDDDFWRLVSQGQSTSTEFPADRLNVDAFFHPNKDRPSTFPLRGGHFIKRRLDAFDAPFFSVSPAEASCMDPQHRHMLETTYHALEDAGLSLVQASGSQTCVYTGCFTNDYLSVLQQDHQAEQRHAAMGIAPSMLANRLSWFFNFKGTSMNIDSACSSSLLALHLACQELATGSSNMGVVGGANLVFHPNFMKMMSDFNFLSPDSRSWSFDKRANGYARGEGIAVIIVKRLDDAIRDGNTIRAVIRSTHSNQDGRTPGITQPSGSAQKDLIAQVFSRAQLDMAPTRFFEAHGTGTPVGDPIEANAIGQAFSHCRTGDDPLFIGAVKANIGHLEGCSGLAGIIKAVLVLEKGVIPPIAGFDSLNERIDTSTLPLAFPNDAQAWPGDGLRRACVNSFGFGGSNAIAVMDDAYHFLQLHNLRGLHRTTTPERTKMKDGSPCLSISSLPKLLVWSAHDRNVAHALGAAYHEHLSGLCQNASHDELAYTLCARRSHLAWRSFAVVGSGEAQQRPDISAPIKIKARTCLAFVFSGQGAQYAGMGASLLQMPAFRTSIDLLEDCLHQLGCAWSLRGTIADRLAIDEPSFSQPVTTCLQIALVDTLSRVGLVPAVVVGHSSGEIAAAYASGMLSRFSAVKVAYYRGLLASQRTKSSPGLSMMAVGLSEKAVVQYLNHDTPNVEIGCVNSPRSVTLTGVSAQLAILEETLRSRGVFARMLRVPTAYHSTFMQALGDDYKMSIGQLEAGDGDKVTPMLSTLTGGFVTPRQIASPDYWVSNMTSTVRFSSAMQRLMSPRMNHTRGQLGARTLQEPITDVLEIGPHAALQGPIRECMDDQQLADYRSCMDRGQSGSVCFLKALGSLHCAGYPVALLEANSLLHHDVKPAPAGMPRYPFNHTARHWREGRLSRNSRFPQVARHDLLGARAVDWNPGVAQWRNVMRLGELAWLRDHRIDGIIYLPAAGMVAMAVQAVLQLVSQGEAVVHGVRIKDVSFTHAVSFATNDDSAAVETQLTLVKGESAWSQFRMFVFEQDRYVESCHGHIRAIFASDVQNLRQAETASLFKHGNALATWLRELRDDCDGLNLSPYRTDMGSGLQYGPAFQCVQHLRLGAPAKAVAEVQAWPPDKDYLIHPTTLDGLAQLLVPAVSQGGRKKLPTMVPTFISRIWISSGAGQTAGCRLHVAAECSMRGPRRVVADVAAVAEGADTEQPTVVLEGLETTLLGDLAGEEHTETRPLCTKMLWKPDAELLSREQLYEWCHAGHPDDQLHVGDEVEELSLCLMSFVLEALETSIPAVLPSHLERYVEWMKHQQSRLRTGRLGISEVQVMSLLASPAARREVEAKVQDSGIEGDFFVRVGRSLSGMLQGQVDTLDLMFRDGLANRYYEAALANTYISHPISTYLDLLCFKKPDMRLLEVGAGTGGQTLGALSAMASDGIPKWDLYDYTDVSPAFFSGAQDKFRLYAHRMDFRVLDICRNIEEQSFQPHYYDVVIASHVLHATHRLDKSLSQVRRLLKPGGKLILVEMTRPEVLHMGFAFGLLRGWWEPLDHEQRSLLSPCLETDEWHRLLEHNGFSGVDVEFTGRAGSELQCCSTIISTATEVSCTEPGRDRTFGPCNGSMTNGLDIYPISKAEENRERQEEAKHISIILDRSVEPQQSLADALQRRLTHSTTETLVQAAQQDSNRHTCVFLLEIDSLLLSRLDRHSFAQLQSVLTASKQVLWVSKSVEALPQQHLVDGLGRVLASEDSTKKFATLSMRDAQSPERQTWVITRLLQHLHASTVESLETSYVYDKGLLSICRISKDASMDEEVASRLRERPTAGPVVLDESTKCTLEIAKPGQLSTLGYRQENTAAGPLGEDEVEIVVCAVGLGQHDLAAASGHSSHVTLGTQGAGTVKSAGTKTPFRQGDAVMFIGKAVATSVVRVSARAACSKPQGLSFAQAATTPLALWLAHHALVNISRLNHGDSVVVHGATTNTGSMAVRLARWLGARTIAICDSEAERAVLVDQHDFDHATAYTMTSEASCVKTVIDCTGGKGAHVMLCASETTEAFDLIDCLSPQGYLIDVCFYRASSKPQPVTLGLNRLAASVDPGEMVRTAPSTAYDILQAALKSPFAQQLSSLNHIPHVFGHDDAEAAFVHLQDQNVSRSSVLEWRWGTTITASKAPWQFASDASYIICGGLGGLGQSICRWMVSRGARHLVLLSRSGARGAAAKAFVHDLTSQGIDVAAPPCDVGNLAQLQKVLDHLAPLMPPFRGCIQAAAAIKDNLFHNMSFDDWSVSTAAKVAASWNLHRVLPTCLDFFVLLSSVNGIFGRGGQANYSAGNTFKDALAHYRIAQQQKAVSIDLGLMVGEGIVAENEALLSSLRRVGHLMDIKSNELMALLDYYCDPELGLLRHDEAQVLVGIEMPHNVRAKGIDLHHSIRRPLFSHLFQAQQSQGTSLGDGIGSSRLDRATQLKEAASPSASAALIQEWLCQKLTPMLDIRHDDFDTDLPLHAFGIDSLVAVDLNGWLDREIGAQIPVLELMANVSIASLAKLAAERCRFRQ